MSYHPEQIKFQEELETGISKYVDSNLDCGQSYGVYKFQPEIGAFSACCDASLINYDHESFLKFGTDYFDKHPELVQRKIDLRNNIRHSHCDLCWKKEDQGITSMRQVLARRDNPLTHQNPYLDIEKSYPSRIELWMNSTCNLGCFMCHIGNSNTLRKIWWKDWDEYGHDGYGHSNWIKELDFTQFNMRQEFTSKMEEWVINAIADDKNGMLTVTYLGGEPTLHNEMFDHVDKFIEASRYPISQGAIRRISITTNGTSKDKLNERFYNMFQKYKEAGWITNIMLSNDAVDEASQVRHGADTEQIMRNYTKWTAPDSVISEVTHFTVLSNLNFPYAHNLAYRIRDIIDGHYKENPEILIEDTVKQLQLSFNPCIAPQFMQIKYLPKKFAEHSAKECIKVYDYLQKTYDIRIMKDVYHSVLNRIDDNPSQEDVEFYFERLHRVQSVYRKTYPNWDFYTNFPHLVEFANDYGIERQ
jgi:organic radical activating enzyme/uncharacterized protein YheU (UPF0270 family)